jgi:hypothetical protein
MHMGRPIPKYTLEELQQSYELNIAQAVNILDKFGSEKSRIDRFMRRCNRRRRIGAGGTNHRP